MAMPHSHCFANSAQVEVEKQRDRNTCYTWAFKVSSPCQGRQADTTQRLGDVHRSGWRQRCSGTGRGCWTR